MSDQSNQFQPIQTNGNGLPPTREAIIEQGLRIQQETAAERDDLRREVAQLKSDIAAYKVAVEAMTMQLAQADSRVATLQLTTDQAVARRAAVETVLEGMLALGRAFQIGNVPLVRAAAPEADDAENDLELRDRILPREYS